MLQSGLQGKRVAVVGVGDEQGLGWACAKALSACGAKVTVGCWVPCMRMLCERLASGALDDARQLPDGSLMELEVLPIDVRFETDAEVPEEVRRHRRYIPYEGYDIASFAAKIACHGPLAGWVHALANAPEVRRPLLETTREGYLEALSASSYSLIALTRHLGPLQERGSGVVALTYRAAQEVIPGYGGGMSSAKAALEADVRYLAYEAGRRWGIRINAISAGPWMSRAARAIGGIEGMVEYAKENAPLQVAMEPEHVGHAACFLLSTLSGVTTGSVLWTDAGLHIMGVPAPSLEVERA